MRESDIVRTVTIKHQAVGTEATKAAVKGVTDEVKKLGDAVEVTGSKQETAARRQASALSGFERLERSISPVARALHDLERAERLVGRAVDQNAALQQRGATIIQGYRDRVAAASNAHTDLGKSVGLARHDLINLGRQIQDVGVSLASGQSPLMVAVQQGTQIADVFASSGVSIRAFFSQAISWGTRFATSAAGVVTGVAAIATGVAAMAASWSSAQKEIDKVLSSAGGAASGVGRGGINRIAEQSASAFGLSVSEAREAATAFAATGKIYEGNILKATQITKQFAIVMGMDVSEAAKKLAQDLQSPSAAASEWAKKITGIDADTVNYIRSLENMGNKQGAITALINAATPGLQKQAEQVGLLAKAYDLLTNSVSDWWERQKRNTASAGDFITGGNMFGSRTDEERLQQLRGRQSNLQNSRTPGLDASQLRAVTAEIVQLEKKLADLQKQTDSQRFNNLSNEMDALARGINTTETQIESLGAALLRLDQYQAERQSRGMDVDPNIERAAQSIRNQLPALIEAEAVERRRAGAVADLVMKYGEVSTATATALAGLEGQLNISRQTTEAARMKAEEEAKFNALVLQGVQPMEAQKIAAAELAVKQAEATSNVERQTQALRDQNEMIRARQNGTEATTAAAIAYRNAIESGADATAAAALRAETLKNNLLQAGDAAGNIRLEMSNLDWSEHDAYVSDALSSQRRYGERDPLAPTTMTQSGWFPTDVPLNLSPDQWGPFLAMRERRDQQQQDWQQRITPEFQAQQFAASLNAQAQFLGGSSSTEDRIHGLELQISALAGSDDPGAYWQIRSLQRSIDELRNSTDELNETMNNVTLNPLYNGRDALRVGYMGAASGLDMMVKGGIPGVDSVPIHIMAQQGERVQVTPAGQVSNDNSKTSNITIIQNFGGGSSSLRRSRRQASQGFTQGVAAVA